MPGSNKSEQNSIYAHKVAIVRYRGWLVGSPRPLTTAIWGVSSLHTGTSLV